MSINVDDRTHSLGTYSQDSYPLTKCDDHTGKLCQLSGLCQLSRGQVVVLAGSCRLKRLQTPMLTPVFDTASNREEQSLNKTTHLEQEFLASAQHLEGHPPAGMKELGTFLHFLHEVRWQKETVFLCSFTENWAPCDTLWGLVFLDRMTCYVHPTPYIYIMYI